MIELIPEIWDHLGEFKVDPNNNTATIFNNEFEFCTEIDWASCHHCFFSNTKHNLCAFRRLSTQGNNETPIPFNITKCHNVLIGGKRYEGFWKLKKSKFETVDKRSDLEKEIASLLLG